MTLDHENETKPCSFCETVKILKSAAALASAKFFAGVIGRKDGLFERVLFSAKIYFNRRLIYCYAFQSFLRFEHDIIGRKLFSQGEKLWHLQPRKRRSKDYSDRPSRRSIRRFSGLKHRNLYNLS